MSLWEWYPGKWLAEVLEGGAVLARTRLETAGADREGAPPVLRFPEKLLVETYPAARWREAPAYRRPIHLSIESDAEEHDVWIVGPARGDSGQQRFQLAGLPDNNTVLVDPTRRGATAVLALAAGRFVEPFRGRLWIACDSDQEADIEEAFDQDGWGNPPADTLLRWSR
ncbi:MAG: hypothetical protein OXQ90_08800 [Gammaproteobacteria bacterium]|nr:hypothetical protein [Gammaproteobacteria bacterium]